MLDQDQNSQNNFANLSGGIFFPNNDSQIINSSPIEPLSDIPSLVETMPEIKIYEAEDKTELKNLEISVSFEKIELIKKIVQETQNNLQRIHYLLGDESWKTGEKPMSDSAVAIPAISSSAQENSAAPIPAPSPRVQEDVIYGESGERIIEGVFNGQNMIGADGKEYIVPANYASKSKLVEGDILKLTVSARGTFLFKQIGPIERTRVIGKLEQNEAGGGYCVRASGKVWKVLNAPITYFRGEVGDETIILVPKNTPSKWAAVENIIKKNGG